MKTCFLKFAFFVDNHISHFHALKGVAGRLIKAGHEVHFFCPEDLSGKITEEGFFCTGVNFLNGDLQIQRKGWNLYTAAAVKKSVNDKAAYIYTLGQKIMADYHPDLIVFDPFLLHYWPAFKLEGVDAVSVSTKPLFTKDRLVPPYTSPLIPEDTITGRFLVQLEWCKNHIKYLRYRLRCVINELIYGESHRSLMHAIAKHSGYNLSEDWFTRPLFYDMRLKSVPELVLHAAEMDFPRSGSLASAGSFIGPCTDLPPFIMPDHLPAGDGPLIWINLGTVAKQRKGLTLHYYRALIEAVYEISGCRAVIATADKSITRELSVYSDKYSDRILVKTWTVRASYLHIADLVVTHGGSNSVKEAVLAGKPMLAIPHSADQPGMAARIVFHGLGKICLQPNKKNLKKVLLELLENDCYKKSVSEMRSTFLRYDDEDICVKVLENAAKGIVPSF
ncbi:hypothetical protein TH53_06860 [Pedobacter lusitanus]|uniref:Glycosyl transferase family 28 C-terminal domain-containing protein n=1 Tax=Pedobacter lusitanus TaxID=1503925 RepID=A0A0D0GU15_9SPHI|nr:glycosyltransferase [Pedobacter lusitanus]KIO77851.1 hypothetical protein TH53_06860 [Pedobacter lusitanus]